MTVSIDIITDAAARRGEDRRVSAVEGKANGPNHSCVGDADTVTGPPSPTQPPTTEASYWRTATAIEADADAVVIDVRY